MLLKSKLIVTEDGGVLLDLENDRLLKLNPIGVVFWQALVGAKPEGEIVEDLARSYGIDQERVQEDLHAFQARISELGLHPQKDAISQGNNGPTNHPSELLPNYPWYAGSRDRVAAAPVLLTACGLAGLFAFDCILSLLSMQSLCRVVKAWPTRRKVLKNEGSLLHKICRAVERSCVWYPKKALCLQRSAVTTCMLRIAGLAAELVIGAQPMPLQAHAWVELEGAVINDHKGVTRVYRVLARY
jgi:hypothetical protein